MSDEVLERITKAMNDLRSVVERQQEATRQHVSGTVGSLAHETEMVKGLMRELLKLMRELK